MSGKNIKCYAYFGVVNGVEYRAGTILVGNDDERIIGNCIMKNPGSARPLDDTLFKREDGRQEFSVDATMHAIVDLFGIKQKGGTINIYNLSDERNPDYNKVKQSLTSSDCDIISDLKALNVPTYIGWGDMWKDKRFTEKAQEIFELVKTQTKGYCDCIENNPFFHPLYLMRYGYNKFECNKILREFMGNY